MKSFLSSCYLLWNFHPKNMQRSIFRMWLVPLRSEFIRREVMWSDQFNGNTWISNKMYMRHSSREYFSVWFYKAGLSEANYLAVSNFTQHSCQAKFWIRWCWPALITLLIKSCSKELIWAARCLGRVKFLLSSTSFSKWKDIKSFSLKTFDKSLTMSFYFC